MIIWSSLYRKHFGYVFIGLLIAVYLFNYLGEYNSEPKSVKKKIPVSGIIIKGSKK